MSDYYATLKIQQGRLKQAMGQLGIKSAAELARRSGVSQDTIGELLNLKKSPRYGKVGKWRKPVLAICEVLGAEPDDIFPVHLDHEVVTNKMEAYVEQAQLEGWTPLQLTPGEEMDRENMSQVVDEVLSELPPRDQRLIKARFWEGKTLDEIGEREQMSRECIRARESRVFRKLRHPYKLRRLAKCIDLEE